MDQTNRPARQVAPRQPRALKTRELLLDAVERLVAVEGGASVTTTQVAAETGLAVGTIYRYFADREALILAAYDRTVTRIVEASAASLGSLPTGMAPAEAAKKLLTTYLAAAEQIPAHVDLLAEMRRIRPIEADQQGENQGGIVRDIFVPFLEKFLPNSALVDPTKLQFASVLIGTMVDLYLVTSDAAARAKIKAEIDQHVALVVDRFSRSEREA